MRTHKNTMNTAILIVLSLRIISSAQMPNTDEGQARGQSHFPEHAEFYVPEPIQMPMMAIAPDGSIELMASPARNRIISFDAQTGLEMILDITYRELAQESHSRPCEKEGIEIPDDQINLMDLAGCGIVPNPEFYPWSANCRLFYIKDGVQYSASGVLIDPRHVLTAASCVHEGNGGEMVSSMVVVPDYTAGSKPYGDAVGVSFGAWPGWTRNGRVDDNLAIIEVDRPIGALAGWHGFGSNDDPSFYTGNDFWMAGFPGEYMWFCYGNFDYTGYIDGQWQYNWLVIENTFQPGWLGSGAYYVDSNSSRYVYGVLSTGTDKETLFARITPEKFYDMVDFINDRTPSTFDLQPLAVSALPERISAGNRPSSLKYIVHNYSSASWSGTVDVNVYLSTNNVISTSDTLLDRHCFEHSFSPKSSAIVEVSTLPAIPGNTAPGRYWIGVILDISDSDPTNNGSDVQAVAPITVPYGL